MKSPPWIRCETPMWQRLADFTVAPAVSRRGVFRPRVDRALSSAEVFNLGRE
jgi:hypothetical protein